MRRSAPPPTRRLAPAGRGAPLARVAFLVLLALGPGGCAHRTGPAPGPTSTADSTHADAGTAQPSQAIEQAGVALRPVDAWPGRHQLRQRVQIDWTGGSETFDAVLQRRPGELVLFGLGPMNLVGFRLALVADDPGNGADQHIEIENRTGRELPFSPGHVLADVQRVFYPWIESAGGRDADCGDCERTGRSGGVEIRERGPAGRPTERSFVVVDARGAGEVRVRYAGWQGDPAFPAQVDLENEWFGYRLRIRTLESTPLPTP